MIKDPHRILLWVIQKIGTLTLGVLFLLCIVYSSLIYGMSESVRGLEPDLLLPYAIVGLIFGWLLARSKVNGRLTAILTLLAGLAWVLLRIGGLFSPLRVTARALTLTIRGALIRQVDLFPLSIAISELEITFSTIINRLYHWAWGIISGNPSFDAVPIAILWSLIIWCLAVWASWAVRRLRHPLLGILPGGILLIVTVNYVRGSTMVLLPMIGGALLLIALLHHSKQVRSWQLRGIDYSEDIQLDFYLVTGFLTLGILSFAFLLPSISIRQIAQFAARLSPIDTQVEDSVAESIGIRGGYSPTANLYTMSVGGLPRSHLLGSGPELSEEIIMLVKPTLSSSRDPNIPLSEVVSRFYWRSLTYDRYIGTGWASSPSNTVAYSANEWAFNPLDFFDDAETLQHVLVRQQIQGIENLGGFIHAAGRLATVDRDYRLSWRPTSDGNGDIQPDDLFGAVTDTNVYQATSLVNAISEDQLRSSRAAYPEWIRDRYLQLPPDIPERVISLAHQITATQSTPYDRAKAIEAYLREFPYTLDLPEPPPDRDVVDYFLFDLQRGYCDYYATAMVVLARAVGLPARMAIGFASGIYDPESDQYIVSAADAHSWPEIYFPEVGWVEFEPTAGQSSLERPLDLKMFDMTVFAEEINTLPGESRRILLPPWPIWIIGAGILAFLIVSVWFLSDNWRLRHLPPRISISRLYRRFYKKSRRLPIPTQRGDTPHQYAASFEQHFEEMSKGKIWEIYTDPIVKEASQLTDVYTVAEYSSHPLREKDRRRAIQIWRSLRWRLWIARWFGK